LGRCDLGHFPQVLATFADASLVLSRILMDLPVCELCALHSGTMYHDLSVALSL